MPLSKARNAERMREYRLHVQPKTDVSPTPNSRPKIAELRQLITSIERGEHVKPADGVQPGVQSNIPLYNPAIHKAGDRVLVKRGSRLVVAVIPKLDADGQVIPEY